jgi:alkanesulfonate monooxygenase SsuD/methylene tetrahydromethanopterin reductase-like flavin-dependent oxidoreductase (luciferase family)
VRIAEEIATVDHISQGRLEFGIGRGTFPSTHDGYNSPFAESRGRFDEFLEIILKAWTTERFSFAGKYYQCDDLSVRPKPLQTPHPPIHVGVTSEETFPLIGRMGYSIIINPSRVFALTELRPYIEQYRQAWQEAGQAGTPQVGLRVPLYVAETAERAYTEPQESALASIQGLTGRVAESASRVGTTGDWGAQAEHLRGMSYDDWLRDKVVYGTPEVVVDRLQQLTDDLGLTQIIYEVNFGRHIPYDLQVKNLRPGSGFAPRLRSTHDRGDMRTHTGLVPRCGRPCRSGHQRFVYYNCNRHPWQGAALRGWAITPVHGPQAACLCAREAAENPHHLPDGS